MKWLFFLFVSISNGSITNDGSAKIGQTIPHHSKNAIVFVETFESERPFANAYGIETGNWSHALQFVTDTVYAGKRSARFEVKRNDPLIKRGKRSEVTIIKGLPGKEMWYSFAVLFPSNGFKKDSERELINQWYQNGSPATSIRVKNDRVYLETGNRPENRKQLDIGAFEKDNWHEFVIHFIHSYGEDGLIEIWYDGSKVINHIGGNMYNDVLPKWKIGIYKTSFKDGTSKVDRRILYFDNIKVGNKDASYDDMNPKSKS